MISVNLGLFPLISMIETNGKLLRSRPFSRWLMDYNTTAAGKPFLLLEVGVFALRLWIENCPLAQMPSFPGKTALIAVSILFLFSRRIRMPLFFGKSTLFQFSPSLNRRTESRVDQWKPSVPSLFSRERRLFPGYPVLQNIGFGLARKQRSQRSVLG